METVVPVNEGAEAFIELLNANGVNYIFLNPGTGSSSIQEALSKYKSLGKRAPEVILCLHEFVAMSAAHGYFMVSGKPQVVLVHLSLGTQQVGGALLNAQRSRIGVVFCATRVPFSVGEAGAGGRTFPLHWFQETFDQAGTVRGYVKWEYELRSNENIHEVVQRAFQVASSEPCGPVYLSLPQELLTQKIKEVRIPQVARHSSVSTPQVDKTLMEQAAAMLMKAEEPLLITGHSGRHSQGVASLVELAQTLGARVVTSQYRMNFPTTHPLFGGFDSGPYIKDADVIFVIDHDVPYIPGRAKLRSDAKIIHFDIDPVKRDFPVWGFPADIFQCGDFPPISLLSVTPAKHCHC